jgi:hypothetical protein
VDAQSYAVIAKLDEQAALLKEQVALLEKLKDQAYHERNLIICALTKLFRSHLMRHSPIDNPEPGWSWIVCVNGPTGQMTWHVHDDELEMFDHLPRVPGNTWDGHDTEEKYRRLNALPRVW